MCVLLVEDEALIASIMSEYLTEAGYDVLLASGGLEAFQLIAEPPFELTMLVTDVHLAEGPSGLDVARRMRERFPHLPLVVATGRPDALSDMPALAFPYRLLRKPYRPSELLDAVTDAIGAGPHGIGGGRERSIDP